MWQAVITGATGVVGSRVLHHLLVHQDMAQVVALGRRAPPVAHDKLLVRLDPLHSAEAMAAQIPAGVGLAFCCLGTTIKQAGSREAFRAVDHDAVVAFGQAALQQGAQHLLVVSSVGANARSDNFYLRTKGQMEQNLVALGYPRLTILRPSFIDDQGTRGETRLNERLGLPVTRALFSVFGRTHRLAPIPADTIARAMLRAALDEDTQAVRWLESDALHGLGSGG